MKNVLSKTMMSKTILCVIVSSESFWKWQMSKKKMEGISEISFTIFSKNSKLDFIRTKTHNFFKVN